MKQQFRISTLQDVMTVLKEDLGLTDLPEVVTDKELIDRMRRSSLALFSAHNPRKEKFIMNDSMVANQGYNFIEYRIPDSILKGGSVLDVQSCDIKPIDGFGDSYISSPIISGVEDVLNYMSSVKLQATMAQSVTHSPTVEFREPYYLMLYNGYIGTPYEVMLNMNHALNLSTIPDPQMPAFKQLLLYDTQEYLYNKFRRKSRVNTGIGEVELDLDTWRDGIQNKRDLLKEWANASALNYQTIKFF